MEGEMGRNKELLNRIRKLEERLDIAESKVAKIDKYTYDFIYKYLKDNLKTITKSTNMYCEHINYYDDHIKMRRFTGFGNTTNIIRYDGIECPLSKEDKEKLFDYINDYYTKY